MTDRDDNVLTGLGARKLVQCMGETAADYLATLAPDQRARGVFSFEDQGERTSWYYTPVTRNGLPLAEMTRDQRRLAHQLVAIGLSRSGYVTASTIIGLETTLDAIEGWRSRGRGRDPQLYYLSIFGAPREVGAWGWRFEGHHLSLNYTIVDGRIVAPTPTFFGSNPAEVALSNVATLRPLAGTEDLARELLHTLSEEQHAVAVLSPIAPSDIVTTNLPQVMETAPRVPAERAASSRTVETVRYTTSPKGLGAGRMNASQREILAALIGEYLHRMPDEIAAIEAARLQRSQLEAVHFAWAGGKERRQPHYYRLQGPRFLVEYDNTQNDANHIHSVWRDPTNDFGAYLLSQHYARSHK